MHPPTRPSPVSPRDPGESVVQFQSKCKTVSPRRARAASPKLSPPGPKAEDQCSSVKTSSSGEQTLSHSSFCSIQAYNTERGHPTLRGYAILLGLQSLRLIPPRRVTQQSLYPGTNIWVPVSQPRSRLSVSCIRTLCSRLIVVGTSRGGC